MLELKAVYECCMCGYKEDGINLAICPKCDGGVLSPVVEVDDLRIFPKINSMAESIGEQRALERARKILILASTKEKLAIMHEARALIRALLTTEMQTSNNDVVANVGREIGELSSALDIITREKKYK